MRIKAVIAYDGSAFYGFQRQKSTPLTVTGVIEKALFTLQIETTVVGSGRTDRGVHATGQVIHFDVPYYWHDLTKLKQILNQKFSAISIRSLTPVNDEFHARFSAKKRLYRYVFKTDPLCVFEQNYLGYYPSSFHQAKLKEALCLFEGEHDFYYFHKTGSQPHTTVRTLFRSRYYHYKDRHIITFEANGFLRSQVRMMVEGSMQYALGNLSKTALLQQIERKKQYTMRLAPASGLYLAKIFY